MKESHVKFMLIACMATIATVCVIYLFSASSPKDERYCAIDSDCSCGVKIGTDECFYGNNEFVDTTKQCPDFCNGIAANLIIICENGACVQKRHDL
jgi:hypothetical protein